MRRVLINADQAADLLSVPKSWILAEARADRIPHVRLGRYVRFSPEDLEQWWATRRRGPRVEVSNAEHVDSRGSQGLAETPSVTRDSSRRNRAVRVESSTEEAA